MEVAAAVEVKSILKTNCRDSAVIQKRITVETELVLGLPSERLWLWNGNDEVNRVG